MKKVFFILLGLVMMAGFLPVNAKGGGSGYGCVIVSCTGGMVCGDHLGNTAVALAVSDALEDALC